MRLNPIKCREMVGRHGIGCHRHYYDGHFQLWHCPLLLHCQEHARWLFSTSCPGTSGYGCSWR
jgi:hypothetical protein